MTAQIAFAGTPDFAVPVLEALIEFVGGDAAAGSAAGQISCVLSQPDRRAGRGRRMQAPPVAQAAQAAGIAVVQPPRLDDPAQLSTFGPPPDVLIVVAYGLLLPQWMLEWARCGAVNVHASLLPRWRGAAPIHRAIEAGDAVTGVSIMQMERGLDTGPVFATARCPIAPRATTPQLHDTLAALGAQTLIDTLPAILDGSAVAQPQDDAMATYARKIDKAEAVIDWQLSATVIDRQVRALAGWPVAESTLTDGRRLRIHAAQPQLPAPAAAPPGTIVQADRDGIVVATGDGALRLTELQSPGARAMPAQAWLTAHTLDDVSFQSEA